MDVDEVLQTIGFGTAHIYLLICCSLYVLASVNDTMGMSIIVVVSQCDLETEPWQKSLLTSAGLTGMSISAFYMGYQTDISGRRRIMRITMLGTCICSMISSLMPNIYLMAVCRLTSGLFLAGPATITTAYFMEFCAPSWRPTMANLLGYNIGFSTIYCAVAAKYFLQIDWSLQLTDAYSLRPWRLLTLIYILPGLCGLVFIQFLPESPSYLISVKRNQEAYAVMSWLCRRNRRKDLADLGVTELKETQRTTVITKTNFFRLIWDDSVRVVKPPYLHDFCICSVLMFGMFFTSIGLGLWFPLLRNQENSDGQTLCDVLENAKGLRAHIVIKDINNGTEVVTVLPCDDHMKNYQDPILFGVSYIAGYAFTTLLLYFVSRKHLICVYLLAATLCCLLLNILRNNMAIAVCFTATLMLPGVMLAQVTSVLVDCMPTQLRGKALSLSRALARLGGILGSYIVGFLLVVSCTLTINIFVFCCGVSVFLACMLPV